MRFRVVQNPRIMLVLVLSIVIIGEGSLLVTDYLAKRLPKVPKECFTQESEYDKWICFEPYFRKLVNKVSVGYAMTEAKVFKGKKVIDDCHLNAHYIGEASLEKHNFNPGKAFAACEFGCTEGCFHGVMERYVRYKADPYTVTSEVKSMCDTVSSPNSQIEALLKSQCAHGIGHGLVAHNFLPPAEAIDVCRRIDYYEERCAGGVIMEYVEQYLSLGENEFKEILPEICEPFNQLDDTSVMGACAYNIGMALMWYTRHDLALSKKLCEELEKPEYVHICKSATEDEEVTNLQG